MRGGAASMLAVAVVLASAPLGGGGRQADLLFAHHTLLAAALLAVAGRSGSSRPCLPWLIGAFCAYAAVLAPYRYVALLAIADVLAAAVVYWLVARAPLSRRSWAGAGLAAAFLLTTGWCLIDLARSASHPGPFDNPRHAAALVALGAACAVAIASGRGPRPVRIAAAVIAGLGGGFLLLDGARGGAIALAAAILVVVALRRDPRVVAIVLLGGMAIVAVPSPLRVRLSGLAGDVHAFDRARIWTLSLAIAEERLLEGGTGLGGFASAARRHKFPVEGATARYGKNANVAHSEYLELLAEASIPGLLLLVVPLAASAASLWRGGRAGGQARERAVVVGAGLTAIAVHAAVDAVLHAPANLYAFALLLGMAAPDGEAAGAGLPGPRPAGEWRRGLAVVVLATSWAGLVLVPWLGDVCRRRHAGSGDPAWLERAIALVPGHAGYRSLRARRHWQDFSRSHELADVEAAIRDLQAAMRLDPLERTHAWDLGKLEHAVALAPDLVTPLGRLHAEGELVFRARQSYQRALALDPTNPFLMVDLAMLAGAAGDFASARDWARRAVGLEPNFRAGHEVLARAARALGDHAAAAAAEAEARRVAALAASLERPTPYEAALVGPGPGTGRP